MTAPRTVLVAEDQESIRSYLQWILQTNGYEPLVGPDGAAALELAAAHSRPIVLIIADLNLPDMSGYNLADRLRPFHPGIKLLLISGSIELPLADSSPHVAFLPKPFTPQRLLAAMDELLSGKTPATG